MTFSRFLKLVIKAPVLAVGCAIVGVLFSALLLLTTFLIHLIGGLEHGQISQLVQVIAKHLPLVFAVGGSLSAFMTDVPISSVFGSARWATGRELQKLSTTDDGLLIGRDPETDALLRYDGPAHLLTMAPTRTGKGVGIIIPNLLTAERSVICVDPKGENARINGRAREQFGPVHILDPSGVTGEHSLSFQSPRYARSRRARYGGRCQYAG